MSSLGNKDWASLLEVSLGDEEFSKHWYFSCDMDPQCVSVLDCASSPWELRRLKGNQGTYEAHAVCCAIGNTQCLVVSLLVRSTDVWQNKPATLGAESALGLLDQLTGIFFFCSIFVWFWFQDNGGLIE